MSIKIKAKIIKEVFRNGDFRILSSSPIGEDYKSVKVSDYGTFSLKGELPYLDVSTEYDLELEELETTKYGTAYKVLSVPSLTQIDLDKLSLDESKEILCTFTTDKQADNILKAYPNFISLVVNQGKESIDTNKIRGVGNAYLSAYARELTSKYKYLHVLNKYKDYNVSITDCKALYKEFRDELGIDKALKEKPYYSLIEVLDRSFDRTDKLLCELREDLIESEQRAEFMVLDVLHRNENDGSTKLNAKDLWDYCHEYDNRLLPYVRKVCEDSELIYFNSENNDVAIMSTYLGEVKIADFVKEKLSNNVELDIDWIKYTKIGDFQMTETQSQCLENFCKYSFSLLVGFSGTGKSYSTKGLVSSLEDNHLSYTLVAPTGRATIKLEESTNRKSSTIHRRCLSGISIDSDVIIIDECSMIDLPTFIMLINSIGNDKCRIVLVGDPAQLLPVGIGCVFNDIINSNVVPMTMLTEVFRYNDSGILYVATEIRKGNPFLQEDNEKVKVINNEYRIGNNYTFIQSDNIFEDILREYKSLIDKGVKPKDILCLSPFNVGNEGTYKINEAIQEEINPPKANEQILSRKVNGTNITFRLGDRVMNTKNDYEALTLEAYNMIENDEMGLLSEDDVPKESVFNGEDGKIIDLTEKKLVAQIGEKMIVFNKLKLNNLLLSFCISVHKSQGSEAKYVINVVSPSHKKLLNKNLLYVADTRGKIKQIDIGDVNTFNSAILIDGNEERHTFLLDLLKEDSNETN